MEQSVRQSSQPITLYNHIRELQMRLMVSGLALMIAGCIVYAFYTPILKLLSSPLGAPLYYNSPAGSFTFIMKICFAGSLIIAIPVLVYNLIMFIQPAFPELLPKKRVWLTTISSTFFAIAGAVFAYTCILPGTLKFFAGFQVHGLNALISADNYLGFVTNIIITFVIVFQIPLFMNFFDSIKPLQTQKLLKNEKWVIIGSLIIALILPFTYDLLTSLLIALPIIVLYNLSIIVVVIRHASAKLKAKNRAHATIASPATASELSLTELTFENLSDELVNLEKPKPASNLAPNYSAVMDIRRQNAKAKVEIPAWVVERNTRRAAINNHVPVFSDFRRKTTVNHALASR